MRNDFKQSFDVKRVHVFGENYATAPNNEGYKQARLTAPISLVHVQPLTYLVFMSTQWGKTNETADI